MHLVPFFLLFFFLLVPDFCFARWLVLAITQLDELDELDELPEHELLRGLRLGLLVMEARLRVDLGLLVLARLLRRFADCWTVGCGLRY